MDIIRFSIRNPVKVVVAVVFILLGGWAAVTSIPVQLMPNVDRPVVSIWTRWDGAAPREVEREIIEPQEEQLKALADLYKMTSASNDSFAMIRLEFNVGVEKEAALREVSERLDLVRRYPDGADERVIQAADSSSSTHVAWLRLHADDGRDIADLQHWVYENVRPLIKRVKGVATVDVWGGREREVQVVIDPGELAARGLTFRDVEHALRGHNTNVSAGTVPSGKRDFTVRTIGQYESLDVLANTIIAYRAGGPVYVRDVAEVRDDFKKRFSFVRSRRPGKPVGFGLSMPIRRETGGNVLEIIEGRGPRKVTRTGTGQVSIERPRKGLKDVLEEINANLLAPRGLHASISYDESEYIGAAIDQVRTNILVGAMLATVVLLLFLRSVRGTAVVAAAIPISAVGTFWGVFALGRSLNVIMLAGMTFAIGMVVDNAIVVLENIHRHREMGKDRFAAAYDGAHEVWGAVLASTLTTMAVFIPVIFIEDEAGQLFRDIAIAVSVGVGLSLIVAITVIPTLSAKLLSSSAPRSGRGRLARVVADGVHRINRTVLARVAVVVMLTGLSVVGMVVLKPPATYMPSGNRNWVSGHLQAPPGRTVDEFRDYAAIIERELTPYWNAELGSPEEQALRTQWIETVRKTTLPEIENNPDLSKEQKEQQIREWLAPPPPIDSFFFGTWRNWVMMGCSSKNPDVARPLEKLISSIAPKLPGVVLTASQNSLLGGGSGNSIAVELSADDLDDVVGAAKAVSEACERKFGAPPSPEPPNFDTGSPELRIVPHHEQAAGLGLSVRDVGFIIEVCVDGALVGEFRDRGESIDLVMKLRETEADGMERIANVPIIAPSGQTIPLSSAVSVSHTTSPTAIHHVEERPAVVLHVAPPEGAALEDAMMAVEEEIIAPLRGEGKINSRVRHKLAGNADKLTRTFDAVKWNLLWALVITYFLIAALFESFTYPFVILFSVPLAAAGGFAGLAVAHHRSVLNPVEPVQQMDILTMLGFVLLIGVVVNNAILLIHQARNNMIHGGLAPDEAIRESVRTRIRPIFMSALTTVCGMLPLVLRFGAGSELYRGMGSVMVGGLIVSTVFTLLLVPTLFSLVLDARAAILRTVGLPALHRIASPARGVVATGRQEER